MAYNQFQSGKLGSLNMPSQKEAEITQDMHLKMSKKIAQLTKVCQYFTDNLINLNFKGLNLQYIIL